MTAFGLEPLTPLDKLIRDLRFKKVIPLIGSGTTLLDVGCGYDANFLNLLSGRIKRGIGIDFSISRDLTFPSNLKLVEHNSHKLPLPSSSVDVATMLAVIEHIMTPLPLLSEIKRVLRPHGKLVLTTPSPRAKYLLEILAKLHLINRKEILDHKNYYHPRDLHNILKQTGLRDVELHKFELGLNTLIIGTK